MQKSTRIFFCFMIISLFSTGIISSANASTYDLGIQKDEILVWKCNVCNNEKLEELFGNKWIGKENRFFDNLIEGARMKMVLKDTHSTKETINVIFTAWSWTVEETWSENYHEERYALFKNPNFTPKDHVIPDLVPPLLLSPVNEYLEELVPELHDGYAFDTTFTWSLILELNEGELDGKYPSEYIKIFAIYDDRGILRSFKLYITDHHVIIDISLISSFNFQLVAFIVILSAFLISVPVIFKKVKPTIPTSDLS